MCMLSLNVRAQVIHQVVKSGPSHPEDVVKHVRGIDIEEVLFKPARGAWFHVPLHIDNMGVPSEEVKQVSNVRVFQVVLLGLMVCKWIGCRINAMVLSPSFSSFFVCKLCFACLLRCCVHMHNGDGHVNACHYNGNDCGKFWCYPCSYTGCCLQRDAGPLPAWWRCADSRGICCCPRCRLSTPKSFQHWSGRPGCGRCRQKTQR